MVLPVKLVVVLEITCYDSVNNMLWSWVQLVIVLEVTAVVLEITGCDSVNIC